MSREAKEGNFKVFPRATPAGTVFSTFSTGQNLFAKFL
jgi:hypothetical protein